MKYKIAGAAVCLCALLLSAAVPLFANDGGKRFHQHEKAEEKAPCSHEDGSFCTHLPLVMIDTSGAEIPGKAVYDEASGETVYTTTPEGDSRIYARMSVINNEKTNNHTADEPETETGVLINVRGNSSRSFDKSGYALRLVDEAGENNPLSIMGMDAHHEWAMHGPFLDKTLLRNYMWYNIAGEIMDYAPNVRFCEAFVNGEYQGVYVMTETITAGRDGARLSLSVDKKDNTFTGYLLKLDRGSDLPEKNINQFSNYTYRASTLMNIEYPGADNITPELNEAICRDFSAFEKALYSYDYDSARYGYKEYIDTQSFIDYFLINEFTCNYDAGWLSTYVYMDTDRKLRMCIWDFNSACDAYQDRMIMPQHFEMQYCLWYVMLLKDEDFTQQLISRYRQLRETFLSEEYLNGYIDNVISYLGPAVERNFEKWGYSFGEEYDMFTPKERNPRSYTEAVDALKGFIRARGGWLDENIDVLSQYSSQSKTKKFNENGN